MSDQPNQHITLVDELFVQNEEKKLKGNQTKSAVALINMFSVQPEDQQKLLDLCISHSSNVVCKFPGFISARFHAALDGTRVIGIFSWESQDDCFAFTQSPGARAVFEKSGPLIQQTDLRFYTLAADIAPSKEPL